MDIFDENRVVHDVGAWKNKCFNILPDWFCGEQKNSLGNN